MFSPFALILIPAGYFFLWPLTDWWLRQRAGQPASDLQVILTALALSMGALATIGMWLGLLPGSYLSGPAMLVVIAAGLAAGLMLNRRWRTLTSIRDQRRSLWQRLVRLDTTSLLLWAIIGVIWILVVHGLYNPFLGDDTLSRYGLHAKLIYLNGHIPREVWGYPPLVPIGYAAVWYAAGQINEHLAQMVPVVMAVATLGATYLFGRESWDDQTGLLGAAITAVTTMFVGNGTLGYTDIPTAFPLTLLAFYALRWWKYGSGTDALLAGLLLAIALLTKQSALTWIASLASLIGLWILSTRNQPIPLRWRRVVSGAVGMLLPSVLIAAPWYIRNGLLAGWPNMLPVAGLYHILGPKTGWLGIIPPLAWWSDFNTWLTPLYAVGWVGGFYLAARLGIAVVRGEMLESPAHLILGLLIIPYWLVWWVQFSFEARFLLLILPGMALWSAFVITWIMSRFGTRIQIPRTFAQMFGAVIIAGTFVAGTEDRLGGVYRAITMPFASEEERVQHVRRDLYNLTRYIQDNISTDSRLMVMDGALQYYLLEYDITVAYPLTLADLNGYDYLVHSSSIFAVYTDRLGWRSSEFYRHVWDPLSLSLCTTAAAYIS
jgi:4-amino-4-deoxy-L-arabinose transferase-like glycosyltransferase